MTRQVCIVVALLASGCAITPRQFPHRAVAPPPLPDVWADVSVGTVLGGSDPDLEVAEPPADVVRRAFASRLGQGGGVILDISALRLVLVKKAGAHALGLRGLLTLTRGDETRVERRQLVIEQSITFFGLLAADHERVYGNLVADFCDRALAAPELLSFLASAEISITPADAPVAAGATDLGPVLATAASVADARASGRVQWGSRDASNTGEAGVLLGDLRGAYGEVVARRIDTQLGFGMHGGGGVMALDLDTGENPLIGVRLRLGVDLGLLSTYRNGDGHVIEPGVDLILSPEVAGFALFGASDGGEVRTLGALRFGVVPAVELPFGQHVGVRVGAFAGGAWSRYDSETGNETSGARFAWFPFGDFFIQTSRARIRLGVSFSAEMQAVRRALGAKGGSPFDYPTITLAYDARAGRGVGRRFAGPEPPFSVLATPFNPFEGLARSTPTAARKAEDPIRLRPALAGEVWAILPTVVQGQLAPQTAEVVARIGQEVLTGAGARVLDASRVMDALAVMGAAAVSRGQLADVAGALAAKGVILLEVRMDDNGILLRAHLYQAGKREVTTEDVRTSQSALLRVVREHLERVVNSR